MNSFFHRQPKPGLECETCQEKNCRFFCPHCNKVYCSSTCLIIDIKNHQRLCAEFWCVMEIGENNVGHFNPAPCEGHMRKHICYGCHKIKELKTKLCENCQNVRYCSVECQQKDWKDFHKKRCSTYRAFRRTRKMRKKFTKNGAKFPDKEILHWSIVKNGKSLPDKYQTKLEAVQALVQLLKSGEDGIYVLGVNHLVPLTKSSPPH